MIHKDLKKLEEDGYIKSERVKEEKRPGNIPTLYSINFNIQNLRRILEEYPGFILRMKISELALESILSEHSDLIYISTKKEYVEQIEDIRLHIEKDKSSLKEKLKSSTEFLRIFLATDKHMIMHRIRKIVQKSGERASAEIFVIDDNPDNMVVRSETNLGINLLFKSCVIVDIANGRSSKKAEECIAKMKN